MTDREILRGTQNILRHSENHQQVFAKRNQRIRGKKEEPFHEDTLMIEDKDRDVICTHIYEYYIDRCKKYECVYIFVFGDCMTEGLYMTYI